ncbi:MAG: bifunctional protein FolD [Candidatus Poribacteria bacterium]|nr:MAG: bifunctional protein FolD [Candidatus Poribacteria bacterium]
MSAEIIDGKAIARQIQHELHRAVQAFRKRTGAAPTLRVLLVGDDPASHSYVRAKARTCAAVGVEEETLHLPAETPEAKLLSILQKLNADPGVHGILVQLPLPDHVNTQRILEAIDPRKDVDGFHPINVGRLALGLPTMEPCTPRGIVELLHRSGHSPVRKHVVIVGRSNLVGKPLMNMLTRKTERENATVTVCHTGTPDLAPFTRQADIVVVAAGRPNTLTGAMIRPGAVVVDVGVNRIDDPDAPRGYRLVGDVDFDSVREVAAAVTPVPGGVGPMTTAMLAYNTLLAACHQVEGLPLGTAPVNET